MTELSSNSAKGRVELSVHAVSDISVRVCPVTGGIPFSREGLSRIDGVRLYDASGVESPLQTEVLATWDPAGEQVRWLLVDFQVSQLRAGRTPFTLVYGPEVSSGERGEPVDPEASSWPPEKIAASLYMVDQEGTRYEARFDLEGPVVETETAGPLRTVVRVHVWHADPQGKRLCRAILRLHYYAGVDRVRVFHSFVMDADPEEVKIRGVGLDLPVVSGAAGEVRVSGEQDRGDVVRSDGPVALFQDRDDHFSISGGAAGEGRRSGTWVCVSGDEDSTGVFVRNGWEEFPKRLGWDGQRIDVQLWPTEGCPMLDLGAVPGPILNATTEEELREGLAEHPGASVSLYRFVTKGQTDWTADSVVSLMERAKELEAELLPDRFAYYYRVFGHNGQGSMVTHEIVLEKLDSDVGDGALTELAAQVRFPPVVFASPEWNCSTGAFGPQAPYGAGPFAEVDRAMTYDELEDTGKVVEDHHLYGARDFGDYINGNPATAGPIYRVYGADSKVRITDRIGWMNNESQDSTIGAWLQFLRTGDPQIFYCAESACEHMASVDQRHVFPAPDRHLAVTLYHTVHHYDGGDCPSHTLSGGYLLGYYITGDRAWRETAIANADFFLDAQERDGTGWYAGTSPSRQNIAPMTCVLNAYTLTWDRKYMESLDRFLGVWAPVYDVTDHGHYLGGTLPYPGAEFARLVDHQAFKEAFQGMMEDIRTKMPINNQSPYYVPGLVYMWEVTGDASYLAYCRFVFEWYAHNLRTRGYADSVRRLALGLPEFPYGMVSGYLAAGLAALEGAQSEGIDLEAATEKLRADRAAAMEVASEEGLYYSIYGAVEGAAGKWYPAELSGDGAE